MVEPQPLRLFKQLCRLAEASTVEVVSIRIQDEEPEVWLNQRGQNDPFWPRKWALPGVIILPHDIRDTENTLEGPVTRLFESELRGIRRVDDLHQLPSQFRFDGRGTEVTTQYWTKVGTGNEPHQGQFFTVDDLRKSEQEGGILEETWLTVDRAIANYEALRAQL